jgi:hypothetical protein
MWDLEGDKRIAHLNGFCCISVLPDSPSGHWTAQQNMNFGKFGFKIKRWNLGF